MCPFCQTGRYRYAPRGREVNVDDLGIIILACLFALMSFRSGFVVGVEWERKWWLKRREDER